MKVFFVVTCFINLCLRIFSQETSGDFQSLLDEVLTILSNGTVEQLFGCTSYDNITEDDISYYLHTRERKERILLTEENLWILNATKDTKILMTGYLTTTNSSMFMDLVKAYLTRYDCNVIAIEYFNATDTEYSQAYCNVVRASELIGDKLCQLHGKKLLDFNKLHMVAISLGAELMGLIGQRVQKQCRQLVDRITGLDPAGPIYQGQDISRRLDKTDARFVDAIHTNMGIFGYYGSVGHVDFFPNCGTAQPGCIKQDSSDPITVLLYFIACSHVRSALLFTESVYGPVFNATSCFSCPNNSGIGRCIGPDTIMPKYAIMGEDCPRNPPAKRFVLTTNGEFPYAQIENKNKASDYRTQNTALLKHLRN